MNISLHTFSYTQSSPSNPLRSFDLYHLDEHQSHPSKPLICFVHGGAWRSYVVSLPRSVYINSNLAHLGPWGESLSEDKADWYNLARSLVIATRCPVAVPNYRLSPPSPTDGDPFRHPSHAEDILQFLNFILESSASAPARGSSTTASAVGSGSSESDSTQTVTSNGSATIPRVFHPDSILLIGHSCSAHMLASIFLDSSRHTPTLTPSSRLLHAVKGIVLSEGIYDLDKIILRFPAYQEWFVEAAFGNPPYEAFSTLAYPLRPEGSSIRWLLVHSRGDTLVDLGQSEEMHRHLVSLNPAGVTHDFDTFHEEHNDILNGQPYVDLVKHFVFQIFDL